MAVPVGIAGIAHYVPDRVIDNEYFTRFVDTSDEWIRQRSGIRQRRWLADDQATSDMFVAAGAKALERAGVAPEEVDLIVAGTVSPDYLFPAAACLVQDRLGCVHAAAFDLSAACPGFLYALSTGAQFIAAGTCRNVLVLGGEALSRMIDLKDRSSCVLFGDGAGAAVLQPHADCGQGRIEDIFLGTDGSGAELIIRRYGGSRHPLTPEVLERGDHCLRMKGREVYRFAVEKMTELMAWAMKDQDPKELGWVVPHQVNARILDTATERLDIPPEKVVVNIDRYGNTSAASIPIILSELWEAGRLESGKFLVLAAFGAGLTWAGARIRW
ncbi:MAG: ketoacyl-ACP synthase III [Planctomycetota bacterium]|nr:MAG: ketoacyl-ACP synthase III [Planctomycetota bacterium]